ncbi:hypothetical protein ESY86_01755 [Subsaximicrobium wynnwilliamsii]|uniref:Lipoprotein n=1 Tax=Subsaximicrobium wynnwilliamsii TaxID=291179 RepID=A0A5C6ZLH3_9FLAO|nr:hypothetical protein [Subsaximicrobium wynnwilliamsii]TXD85363.1 hypothetical protein ESY87_00065 [Subsaximicrobium wynnwilliamsii]TXD90715.1 hypothetical protein ESY86_01755 [Subsaximicrobium wynnwilliamsii]TXE05223.1 hypothetical protein ESY88_00065 [Subsaximicrobium wynnwilliamsii]
MNRFLTLLVVSLSLLFTSCEFSEDVYINEDGSGSMTFSVDASAIMEMAANMGAEGEKKGLDKTMDSTIVLKQLLEEKKDSISKLPTEDQEKLKALEDFKMHISINPETKKMLFDMSTEFKKIGEIQKMFKGLNAMSSMNTEVNQDGNGAGSPFNTLGGDASTEVSYAFDGKTFKRSAKIVDQQKHQQAMDSLGDSAMMFGSSRYKLNYHFPRAIKSVSKEDVTFSEDRKTVIMDLSFMSVLRTPEILDFEVVLEDK